jgi:hypothetical protein
MPREFGQINISRYQAGATIGQIFKGRKPPQIELNAG